MKRTRWERAGTELDLCGLERSMIEQQLRDLKPAQQAERQQLERELAQAEQQYQAARAHWYQCQKRHRRVEMVKLHLPFWSAVAFIVYVILSGGDPTQ